MLLRSLICAGALSVCLAAQTQSEFEVASIRPSAEPDQQGQATAGVRISGSQVRMSFFSLKDYVSVAYELPLNRVEGPDWLGQTRFDIAAKLPEGSSQDQVAPMLRKLLETRFEMKAHRSSKEFPVYALKAVAGGPKLKEAAVDPNAVTSAPGTTNVTGTGGPAGATLDLGDGSSFSLANNRVEFRKVTMESMVQTLTRLLDRAVIDTTGLTGRYDLTFELSPEDYNAVLIRSAVNAGVVLPPQALRMLDAAPLDPLSNHLQRYGLTLEARRSQLDVIIVESMRRTPTEN